MPTVIKLRLPTPTAGNAGRKIYIAWGALQPATQAYQAGPYVGAFRGSTDVIINDLWNVTVSNDRAGVVQTLFEQVFEMSAKGLILPSSGAPNIPDSVVA